jgi:hypothetical protein
MKLWLENHIILIYWFLQRIETEFKFYILDFGIILRVNRNFLSPNIQNLPVKLFSMTQLMSFFNDFEKSLVHHVILRFLL